MDKSLLCSIIVITYKQLEYLERTIKSIIKQSYNEIEVIIADDGTPDFDKISVITDCKKLCNKRGFDLKIVHQIENVGTVKNLNAGLKIACGELIIPMAGDGEFYCTEAVSVIVTSYIQNKWYIAACKQILSTNHIDKEVRPYKNEVNMIQNMSLKKLALRIVMFPCFIGGNTVIYSRQAFDTWGCFDENYKLLEDCPFYVKFFMNQQRMFFINKILIRHNIDDQWKPRNANLIKDDMKVIDDILSNYKITKRQKKLLAYRKKCLQYELARISSKYFDIRYIDCILQYLTYKILQKIRKKISWDEYITSI